VLAETVDNVDYSSGRLVNWATGWKIAGKLFDVRRGKRFAHNQPSVQWVLVGLSLKVNLPRRELNYSPPCNAEVDTNWSYTISFPYATSSRVQGQLDLYYTMHIYGVV
jgi:hypothetical protein